MHPQAQELIEKVKEKQSKQLESKRIKHLTKLGLIDKSKTITHTSTEYVEGYTYNHEKHCYTKEIPAPIELTDEEYEELCKWCPVKEELEGEDISLGAEKTLNTIASISLVLGILTLVGGFFASLITSHFIILAYCAGVFFTTIVVWAQLKVFSNISRRLYVVEKNTRK